MFSERRIQTLINCHTYCHTCFSDLGFFPNNSSCLTSICNTMWLIRQKGISSSAKSKPLLCAGFEGMNCWSLNLRILSQSRALFAKHLSSSQFCLDVCCIYSLLWFGKLLHKYWLFLKEWMSWRNSNWSSCSLLIVNGYKAWQLGTWAWSGNFVKWKKCSMKVRN